MKGMPFHKTKQNKKQKRKRTGKRKKTFPKRLTRAFSLFLEHYDKRNRDIVFGVALLFLGCGCKEER